MGAPERPHHRLDPPSDWVLRFASLIAPGGVVLDLACGTGRHTRLFLERGHPVVAIDRYNAGIVDLLGRPDFEFIDADLESGRPWPLGQRRFAGIVVTNYLHRPLLAPLIEALAADGVLIYETFARGNERLRKPRNPDFLLEAGELLEAVRGRLAVVAFEDGLISDPRPAVIQRICATNDADSDHAGARALDGGA